MRPAAAGSRKRRRALVVDTIRDWHVAEDTGGNRHMVSRDESCILIRVAKACGRPQCRQYLEGSLGITGIALVDDLVVVTQLRGEQRIEDVGKRSFFSRQAIVEVSRRIAQCIAKGGSVELQLLAR